MATKREVMLAGTPAKLAHMLASDNPAVLMTNGTDQASAALVETNFQVLYGGTGAAVRLRPATGQFLHFLFNGNFYTVAVYPDSNEWINDSPPSEPFLLEAFMTGVFAPARRQWIAGQVAGSGTTGEVPAEIPGPFGVGVTPPADARPGTIFANNQMVLVPGQSLVPGGDLVAHLFYNAYLSTNDTINYLTNGPAYDFSFDSTSGGAGPQIAIRYAPPGTAGASVPWERIINFDPGVIMIDPVSLMSGDLVGHVLFNGLFNVALNNWVYFANGPAADFVYDATSQQFALRQAPPGTAGAAIPFVRTNTWFGAPQGSGQTNMQLLTDDAGTVTLQTVMVGPAGSGPGGAGRALYVAT
jgi:hypothetical protein